MGIQSFILLSSFKGVQKNVEKKTSTEFKPGTSIPTAVTPTSLTTEPLLPWLITSLNFCFINEISSGNLLIIKRL